MKNYKWLTKNEMSAAAKEWAEERSNGNKQQDEDCEYDFLCGMFTYRSALYQKYKEDEQTTRDK